jgi:hypothetical protein
LRTNDCGRRLTDFASNLRNVDLAVDLNDVLHSGIAIDREVTFEADHKSHAMLMRVRPYRTVHGSLDGLVLSFFDVHTMSPAASTETVRDAAHPENILLGENSQPAEAIALANLHEASTRLWRSRSVDEGLQDILAASIKLLGADMGNVQLLDGKEAVLRIAAQQGFSQEFLDFFREVPPQTTRLAAAPCARASALLSRTSKPTRNLRHSGRL